MSKPVYQWILYVLLVSFVAGCGGTTSPGSDSGGSNPGGGNPGNGNSSGQPALIVTAESPQLPSAADNANSELHQGVELMAMVSSGTGSSVVPSDGVTFKVIEGKTADTTRHLLYDRSANDNKAILLTGGDPTERTITVRATTHSGLSDIVSVNVTGTSLQLTGPNKLLPGESAHYTATLTNSAGEGLENKTIDIQLSGETHGLEPVRYEKQREWQTCFLP